MSLIPPGIQILGSMKTTYNHRVLTTEALEFMIHLHRKFNTRRLDLLEKRKQQQQDLIQGKPLGFLSETKHIRDNDWQIAETPKDLLDRRVEITGPPSAKMMINALNSGAKVFMADLEDSMSPTWENVIDSQINLQDAVRHNLKHNAANGKNYKLNKDIATLLVRPRGWHLPEKNIIIDGEVSSGSLTDFGLYFFHNAKERQARGTAPYFYLPKLENHLEARLWNEIFVEAQNYLKIPVGTIKATVLIETILASYEMDEILYELKDHSAGLNAGRWDYIFSVIKKFSSDPKKCLPDRRQITMEAPFMEAYCKLLVKTCHKRNAHAIGGMAAFIPSRKDEKINKTAFEKVTNDKKRESDMGFDGTWVAHPDLVDVARKVFDSKLGTEPNQRSKQTPDISITSEELSDFRIEGGQISSEGVGSNIRIAIQYIDHWLNGTGAVALYNLMEDAATAEISRAQLWQWLKTKVKLEDGRTMDSEVYQSILNQELQKLGGISKNKYREVVEILNQVVLGKEFEEFLTIPAYAYLDAET